MRADKWAQDIVLKYGSITNDDDLEKGYKKVCIPKIGDVVFYKNKDELFQKVKILSGQYFDSEYGRLSNFWYWLEIDEDGVEFKEEHRGYGNFFIKTNQQDKE